MKIMKVYVGRMTTSRVDNTKYEHYVTAINSDGKEMSFWMHHNPQHALFEAHNLANFLGVEVSPLIIDGEEVKLDEISRLMLED